MTSYHEQLAALWSAYNSRSGRPSPKQVARILKQLSVADLTRMLTERRVALPGAPPAIDVRVENHGSVVILQLLTRAAREWADAYLPEDRQTWGTTGTVVEPRYVLDIVQGMDAAGLRVQA